MTNRFPRAFAPLLLMAGLGACSQSSEAPTRDDNAPELRAEPTDAAPMTAPETRAPDPAPTPLPTADTTTNVAAALPERAPPPAPDEQLLDDASATGMTARTTRGDQTNQAAPAEPAGDTALK